MDETMTIRNESRKKELAAKIAGMEAAKKELEAIEQREREAEEAAARAGETDTPIRLPPGALDIKDAAAFLRLKPTYIYQLVHGRKLTAYKPGGKKMYFRQSDLEAYAFRNRQMSDHEAREMADNILTANMMA